MRNRRTISFNNQSFNIDQLPIKRILLLAILAYLLMAIELFFLTGYRMLSLPNAAALLCGDAAEVYVPCVNEVIKIMLFGGQWSAIKFSIYVFTLAPLFYLLMVRQKGSPASSMSLLTLILLMVIIATIQPPWIELAAVLTSSLLAGSLIKKRRDKLKPS
jgi:hypothetical protein